jgi:hypothetical protein
MKPKTLLISSAIVYKKPDNKALWFIIRQNEENGWEIPKTTVRRGESSVRAVIRMMGDGRTRWDESQGFGGSGKTRRICLCEW